MLAYRKRIGISIVIGMIGALVTSCSSIPAIDTNIPLKWQVDGTGLVLPVECRKDLAPERTKEVIFLDQAALQHIYWVYTGEHLKPGQRVNGLNTRYEKSGFKVAIYIWEGFKTKEEEELAVHHEDCHNKVPTWKHK